MAARRRDRHTRRVSGRGAGAIGWLAAALLLVTACGFEAPTDVAVIPVPLSSRTVYIKRQTWGFNGDQTVISLSPDWRDMPRAGDRRWCAAGPPEVLYRVEGDTLHIWDDAPSCWKTVPGAARAVPVVVHGANVMKLIEMNEHPAANGIRRIGPHQWPLRKVRFWER